MVLIPFAEEIEDDDLLYRRDNAAIRASKHAKRWLHLKDIEIFDPAPLIDLIPTFEYHRKSLANNWERSFFQLLKIVLTS